MYADWGVDFLKYDICSLFQEMENLRQAYPETPDAPQEMMIAAFGKMGLALKATGRPIVYSLSEHGIDDPWKWAPALGANIWRITADILAARLMAGNDLTRMSDSDKRILMNREVISIDQDPLGAEGNRLYQSGDIDVWTKPLSGGLDV